MIAAATASGSAAIGVLRLSGPETLAILARHCRKISADVAPDFASAPRRAIFCRIVDASGAPIDEALVIYFAAPASYTGEDSAELSLHGNPLLLRKAIEAMLSASVAEGRSLRPAGPGEFTRRAYLNGRMDLTRAEAVHRVVTARSEIELEASRKNLYGELSRLTARFRSALIHLKAETEAEVDFSTEDLTFESREARQARVRGLIAQIDELLRRGRETERLRHGFQAALVGAPNAGKSSLMNRMLGWDRSIVSPIAGTTRDYVAETIQFEGAELRLVDTAGLRDATDVIEEQGVRLSRETMRRSQIILHVIDGALPPYPFPHLEDAPLVVHVFNKIDVADVRPAYRDQVGSAPSVAISCATGAGIDELRGMLRELLLGNTPQPDVLLLEDRHRFHFLHIKSSLERVLELWGQAAPDEITALEIDRALEHAGAITGRIDAEEILGRIFSIFCVGK